MDEIDGKRVVVDIRINESGDTIPVSAEVSGDEHIIKIDGVEWVRTTNYIHASVMFNMICNHITEYMNYELR